MSIPETQNQQNSTTTIQSTTVTQQTWFGKWYSAFFSTSSTSTSHQNPIINPPDPISKREEQIKSEQLPKTSWFSWRPTSDSHLAFTEKKMLSSANVEYKQSFVKVNDPHQLNREILINTVKIGEHVASKPNLVMLHGFGAGNALFTCNLKDVSHYCNIWLIDLPGFGRSSRFSVSDIKDHEHAEDLFVDILNGWTSELKLEKFCLLGHSFGGFIAAAFAMRYPSKIEKLILADPWGVPIKPQNVEQNYNWKWKLISSAVSVMNPLSAIRVAGPWGPALVSKFRPDIPEKFTHLWPNESDRSHVSHYIYHLNAANPCGETLFSLMTLPIAWAAAPLRNRLPEKLSKSIPILLLYGEYSWMDPKVGMKFYQEMEGKGFNVNFQVISDSGHHIYVDNYPEFNSIVSSFVERK